MKKHKLPIICSTILATSLLLSPAAEAATYVVEKGDNLTKISKSYNTTVNDLKAWNDLKNDTIYVGQTLIVANDPKTSVPPTITSKNKFTQVKQIVLPRVNTYNHKTVSTSPTVRYTVVSGDTLSKIAKQYNVTVESLQSMNNLTSDRIYVGQVLNINTTTVPEVKSAEFPENDVVQLEVDQAIAAQLAKEKMIVSNPKDRKVYEEVTELAKSLVDTPYVFGGNSPDGFDCSGFVQYVYSTAGLSIVRESSEDYFMNNTTKVKTPVAGDVIFFKNTYKAGISHMGIYIGDGEFIHAGSQGVEVSKLEYGYWDTRFVAFKRFNDVK